MDNSYVFYEKSDSRIQTKNIGKSLKLIDLSFAILKLILIEKAHKAINLNLTPPDKANSILKFQPGTVTIKKIVMWGGNRHIHKGYCIQT